MYQKRYDSLAEGYRAQGDREAAINNYRKSLALNPGNTNAVEMLKNLGAAPFDRRGESPNRGIKRTRNSDSAKAFKKATSTLSLKCYKVGTKFGTQKCAERAVEAVDAVQDFLWKFGAR